MMGKGVAEAIYGQAAQGFSGQSPEDIRNNADLIRAGRVMDEFRQRGEFPIAEVDMSSLGQGERPPMLPPGEGVQNLWLLKTEQGYVPVINPGYWENASTPMFAPRDYYQPMVQELIKRYPSRPVDMRQAGRYGQPEISREGRRRR